MNRAMLVALLGCILLGSGCTTLQPIEASEDEVQRQLLSENLLRPGDRVRLVTRDGSVHKFRVSNIDLDQGMITGRKEHVAIADVIAVETREVSVGKTALLVGGVGYGVAVIIAIAIAPAILLGGG